MVAKLRTRKELYQQDAASEIKRTFGADFVYVNRNGNLAIRKDVLEAFRRLTEKTVVWHKVYRIWRHRRDSDPPGRQVQN
jgi:hypothetical protein